MNKFKGMEFSLIRHNMIVKIPFPIEFKPMINDTLWYFGNRSIVDRDCT